MVGVKGLVLLLPRRKHNDDDGSCGGNSVGSKGTLGRFFEGLTFLL